MERGGMHMELWWGNHEEKDHYEDTETGKIIILKWILEKQNGAVWTGFIYLRMGTSGGLL
jgi:hypothetical protein